jgi:hypothetical protein
MKAIIAQLIAAAIAADKIPSLDCFDMNNRESGEFSIRLNDGTEIVINCTIKE